MLSFSLDASAARDRLDAMPRQIHDALLQKIDALRQDLYDCVVDQKLSGEVLHAKSGALRASIFSDVLDQGDTIRAVVGSAGDVKYAAIQEFGGKTAAHDILPDKAKALAFVGEGKQVFAKIVHHPGSTIPQRSYLRSALADMRDAIVDALTQAAVDGLAAP
jgi:phage gpG-like protein